MNNRHDDVPLLTEFDSSAIVRAPYDPEDRALDIWYKGGDRYRYFGVPAGPYLALRAAPSAGEYVNGELKPAYRCEIEPRRERFRPD